MNRDHYTMDHFEVHLGLNNNAQMIGTHHPHFDHYGSWNFLHGKIHSLIDVVQPATGMSANIDFRYDDVIPCPLGPPPTHLSPIKIFTGEAAETVWKLRSDIPYLNKMEISDYRNSFYQNLCLCMLSMGYHRAFTELFSLINRQEAERQIAGPDSLLWSRSPISMQEEKLTLLKDCLCAAEDYYRVDDYNSMLESYNRLANFFQDYPEDKWLVDHFLLYSWRVSKYIKEDDYYKHALANYELGIAIAQNETYKEAFDYFYILYNLANGKTWRIKNKLLVHEACEHLAKIRLKMADLEPESYPESTQKITYLREAYDFSKESGNQKLEGTCTHKLGMAYFQNDKADIALSYLMHFYSISKGIEDAKDICMACESLALVYRAQKKYDDSIRFLEEFIEVAELNKLTEEHSRGCRGLGDLYNHLGQFDKATGYFSSSFGISRGSNNSSTVDEARILFGVSQGNNINLTFAEHVEDGSKTTLTRLINWKKDLKVETSDIGRPIPNKHLITIRNRGPKRDIFESIGAYPKL